jgi:nucleoside-diphosphate-sugar epimerase
VSRTDNSKKTVQDIAAIKPTQVYHLAGLSRVSNTLTFPDYFLANTVQFQNVLEALEKANHPVKVMLASSIHLYGQQVEVSEESEIHPQSSYAYSKYLAEEALKVFCKKSPTFQGFSVRLASCIGPDQSQGFVTVDLAKKIKKAIEQNKNSLQVGSLESFRQFLDVQDAAKAFILLMEHSQKTPYEAFNLAGIQPISIQNLLNHFIHFSKNSFDIEKIKNDTNSFSGVKVLPGKFQKIFPDFTFRPIENTLKEVWDHH